VILENHVVGSLAVTGGAGIHLTGTGVASESRIESNHVMQTYRGIQIDTTNNLIIKNSVGGTFSSPYKIVAANVANVVLTQTGGAIDGNNGGAAIGTTDPWANVAY
jgi:hypothetical protein